MNHVKKLTFPKGTSKKFIDEVASKICSWHLVTDVTIEKLEISWGQVNFYSVSTEGLTTFVEGLMLGFNLNAKVPVRCTVQHPRCNPITY